MSHLHAQVLGFHIYPLLQVIIPAKSSLQSQLQVSLFQICLLLDTDEFNRHTHLQLSCHNNYEFHLTSSNCKVSYLRS